MRLTIDSRGARVVAERRPGRGVPLVLVHGSGGGLHSWAPVVGLLPDRYETWVYARRGFAPSDPRAEATTFADDVADLQAVIDAAGGRAHVVGMSHGATVGLHHALARPDAVVTLSLFEPPLFAAGPRLAPALDEYRAHVDAGRATAAQRVFAARAAQVPAELLGPEPADLGARTADEDALVEAVADLHDLESMGADDGDLARWAGVRAPVLLMEGADTWQPMPRTMDALAEVLPQVTRVRWEGQTHFAAFVRPDLVVAALEEFLPAPSPTTSRVSR